MCSLCAAAKLFLKLAWLTGVWRNKATFPSSVLSKRSYINKLDIFKNSKEKKKATSILQTFTFGCLQQENVSFINKSHLFLTFHPVKHWRKGVWHNPPHKQRSQSIISPSEAQQQQHDLHVKPSDLLLSQSHRDQGMNPAHPTPFRHPP